MATRRDFIKTSAVTGAMTHRPMLRLRGLTILLALGWPALGVAQDLVIDWASAVDVVAGTTISGATILIRDGRIQSIGPSGGPAPAGVRLIDGRGLFVIPGLWDMHVHLGAAGRGSLATLVRYGVTSVRDLGGSLDSVLRWRREVRAGAVVGPRIMVAGPIIENGSWKNKVGSLDVPGIKELMAERIGVDTPEQARRAVARIAALGVDVVKVRNSPPRAAYAALMASAGKRGLFTAGHLPGPDVGLAGALATKMRSIEHLELLGDLEKMPAARRDRVVRGIVVAEMWIDPTLSASFLRANSDSLIDARVAGNDPGDSLASLVTPQLRAFWQAQRALKPFDAPREYFAEQIAQGLEGLRRFKAGGVKLLAGTDLGVLLSYPGHSLHDELIFLVDSLGLTPAEAIRTATVEPARYFRMTDSLGTIAPGQLADLVLLAGNPLLDIRNIRRVAAVVVAGRLGTDH